MCSQLIQHVNNLFEICANVSGSPMDFYKDLHGSYVGAQRAVYGSLYGSDMGPSWIPIRIYMDAYMILYGSL